MDVDLKPGDYVWDSEFEEVLRYKSCEEEPWPNGGIRRVLVFENVSSGETMNVREEYFYEDMLDHLEPISELEAFARAS